MKEGKEDIRLWNQIKKGDIYAYHELYDRYINTLFTFGMQYTGNDELVQDAIHDIFVDLHRYRNSVTHVTDIKSYLFKSLRSDIFKKLKNQQRLVNLESVNESANSTNSVEDDFIFTETAFKKNSALAAALNSLTKKQRTALQMRFYDDLTYDEISDVLGISMDSCRTLIYRSLKELRAKL